MAKHEIVRPQDPLKIALLGAGGRARGHYCPLFKFLRPWVEVVAVCDPIQENCDQAAEMLGIPAYYDIQQLVKDKPMEAALVVTPIPSHHSISVYLSRNGIHSMCETTWCSTLAQARQMMQTASDNNVIVRVAENFFRFSIDRFAQTLGIVIILAPYKESSVTMTTPVTTTIHDGLPSLSRIHGGCSLLSIVCLLFPFTPRRNASTRAKTSGLDISASTRICWLSIRPLTLKDF